MSGENTMKRFKTFLTEANVDLNDWTKTFSKGAYTNQLRIVGWYKYIKNKFPGPYSALVDLSRKGNDIQSRTVELTSTGKSLQPFIDLNPNVSTGPMARMCPELWDLILPMGLMGPYRSA